MTQPVLVIHGGAGNKSFEKLEPAALQDHERALHDILSQTHHELIRGMTALDAVLYAATLLEDCPYFNAGQGAVMTSEGTFELDAAIMDGKTGQGAGICGLNNIKNPVHAARLVMENTPHKLLAGPKAESFVTAHGLETAPDNYFKTDEKQSMFQSFQKHGYDPNAGLGTVGAVAMDKDGNLAAATSTGGLNGKMPGRISDSAILGAGTWAQNDVCALSCTGTGDSFIQKATAHNVAALMEYKGLILKQAIRESLKSIKDIGGSGGIIGIDTHGQIVVDYNTTGMYRGFATADAIITACM